MFRDLFRFRVARWCFGKAPTHQGQKKWKPVLEVLEERAVPAFLAGGDVPLGMNPKAVAVGDFNHDGISDLAVANTMSGTISVFLGKGDGTFAAPVNYGNHPEGPEAITAADLTGDGNLDLVVAYSDPLMPSVVILKGKGDGTFEFTNQLAVGRSPSSVVVADLNKDGHPDIITADQADSTLSVLLGDGTGNFQPRSTFSPGSQCAPGHRSR
jgi:hypothetical protein